MRLPDQGANENDLRQELGWHPSEAVARVFSGHESFVCRYGWLPKLYEAVSQDPDLFLDDERSILALGLGKNMVRSIRFWGENFGLLTFQGRRAYNTALAKLLLDPEVGLDPFLEDLGSLWRLHWRLTTRAGLGAWCEAFFDILDQQVTREKLTEAIRLRALGGRGSITSGTAAAHVDVFLRTYDASRRSYGEAPEDGLETPFQELQLLTLVDVGGVPTIRFSYGMKNELDIGAVAFALHDYWVGGGDSDKRLSVRSLLMNRRSLGAVFKLDEVALQERLTTLCDVAEGIELREDGAGGLDLIARSVDDIENLQVLAWPKQ